MDKVLEVTFSGWTATPRMPFVLSGNAVCMATPSYSLLLGMIGCCLGRLVSAEEVRFGFKYEYDSIAKDLETRQRLEYDGRKIKAHAKGSDAYNREFHVLPKLTLWLDRTDWKEHFINPVGTPSLGRSQDILKIESVRTITVVETEEAMISGCMLPFNSSMQVGGQLVQLAEAYQENEEVGAGRKPVKTGIFISIPHDNVSAKVKIPGLYQTQEDNPKSFYLHTFSK
jgi:CRISPR-associated protein Cas5t